MSKKRKGTPDELDYLFERNIVDEEDYVAFWSTYWKRDAQGRRDLEREYVERAAELDGALSVGVVTKDKLEAIKQAQALGDLGDVAYKVVRRNKRGRFSKRGHFYQAVRKGKP